MPPKKAPEPPALPEVEDEVELPEEVGPITEPSFCLVLGHLAGHNFKVREPRPEGSESPAPVQDFDPCSLILEHAKQPAEALAKRVIILEKEELLAYCTEANGLQDKPVWSGLRYRLEKEREARSRAKSNAARRKAIESFEASKAAEEGGEAPPEPQAVEDGAPEVDVLFLLKDAPEGLQELTDLSAEGLCADGPVDLWTAIYFAGITIDEGADAEVVCETPEVPRIYDEAIQAAPRGSDISNCSVCVIRDSQSLAFAPPAQDTEEGAETTEAAEVELTPTDRAQAAMLQALGSRAESAGRFKAWVQAANHVNVPDWPKDAKATEDRLYKRMIGAVDQTYHDVPLFLHCLTEQVERTLGGEAQRKEDEVALASLEEYLGMAYADSMPDGAAPEPRTGAFPGTSVGAKGPAAGEENAGVPGVPGSGPLVPFLDQAACRHQLGRGGELDSKPALESVHDVLAKVSVPGSARSGLPKDAVHSAAEREALKCRFYPFAPGLPAVDLEQMLLLQAFQDLLSKAQSERQWSFSDRIWREWIPAKLLGQRLEEALRTEPFVDTAYLPRHDCLLVVLHHRSMPGRLMWHAWHGDMLSDLEDGKWKLGTATTAPTFNDWSQVFGAGLPGAAIATAPKTIFDNIDGRELGYNCMVEKLSTPSDGSLVIVTRMEHGLRRSCLYPGNVTPEAGHRFQPEPRQQRRLARVFKDGLTFGMVEDRSWKQWQVEDRRQRCQAEAEAAFQEQQASAEPVPADPTADRPPSAPRCPVVEPTGPFAFEDWQLGSVWIAFPNGARLTARMHHESAVQRGALTFPDQGSLSDVGATLTYCMATGQMIQVFSDGSVRLSCPAIDGSESLGNSTVVPGCPQDFEVMRTATPFGSLIRRLVSGRTEVFQADGTVSFRNPTAKELEQQLESLRSKLLGASTTSSAIELLSRMLKVYKEQGSEPLRTTPSDKQKAMGLPGHWVIVRTDGHMYGRAPVRAEVGSSGQADGGEVQTPPFEELLNGVLVDGGALVEYEINGVSQALQVDLMTRHRALTNSKGFASFDDPEGLQKVSVHADGTRITKTAREYGYEIEIYKEPMALIRCEIREQEVQELSVDSASSPGIGMHTYVDCHDGTRIEVTPQMLVNGDLVPLAPDEADWTVSSTHASVVVRCREGNTVCSAGDGSVQIFTAKDREAERDSHYHADCSVGQLSLRAGGSMWDQFKLSSDQTLEAQAEEGGTGEPRCERGNKAYPVPELDAALEDTPPPPRLFIVHGNGEAEELLPAAQAEEILQVAQDDPMCIVVGNEPLADHLPNCKSHTIFRTRMPDSLAVPQMGSVALPEGCVDGGASICSVITNASQQASLQASQQSQLTMSGAITEFRQLIEFPEVTEEDQAKLQGTLKQYREWEATQLKKQRDAAKPPDPKAGKGKKKDRGKSPDKGGKDKKGKKGKKGKVEEEEVPVEKPPEPAFAQGFKINPFEHHVQVFQGRSAKMNFPTSEELLNRALASLRATGEGADAGAEVEANPDGLEGLPRTPASLSRNASANVAGGASEVVDEAGMALLQEEELAEDDVVGGMAEDPGYDQENVAPTDVTKPAKKNRPPIQETEFSFAYFKSETGLQFLMETGALDPECKPLQASIVKEKRPRPPAPPPQQTPWNPRLVGEQPDEPEQQDLEEEEAMEDGWPGAGVGQNTGPGVNFAGQGAPHEYRSMPEENNRMPFSPSHRMPIVPEKQEEPLGPHPNKKGPLWDVYGEPRPPKGKISQAYVAINDKYLQVEGATDRRVRTASIAHKKNAAKAPSVQTVRKTGTHAVGRGSELGAKEILGEMGITAVDEHWKLSSTMQGLGDPNQLVEVMPGSCRFGPLRQGSLYRMSFFMRNCDVDVTRFNVKPPVCQSKNVLKVDWSPKGHLAPGMATKVTVEVACLEAAIIQQLVEIQVKAHIVRVPVTARVWGAEQYDRLEAESLALHGRRIGRHRERTESQKPGPVQLIAEPDYCSKIFAQHGEQWQPPPPEFDDQPIEELA